MHVVITGGCGFIGSALVQHVITERADWTITVVDNKSSGQRIIDHPSVTYCFEDICDIKESLLYTKRKPTVIFHLAAKARIKPSFDDPGEYYRTNVLGTQNMCKIARDLDATLIYAASSTSAEPYKNPYAASKHAGEVTVKMYHTAFNMRYHIARFFNVYGANVPSEGPAAMMLGIFMKAMKDGETLPITNGGAQRRDFTHVHDICCGLEALAVFERRSPNCLDVDFGTGNNFSVLEIADMLGGQASHIGRRSGEMQVTKADARQTWVTLGWKPYRRLTEFIAAWKRNNGIR